MPCGREEPRCGFSRKVVEAVKGTGLSFETFDILSDEEVRQGLKEFSNWPTYPQLYAGEDVPLSQTVTPSLVCVSSLTAND